MRLAVLGAGAWGTALAAHAARRGAVALWARDTSQVDAMAATRRNRRYLPEVALPDGVAPVADLDALVDAALHHDALLVVATPMAGLEPVLGRIGERHAAALGRGEAPAPARVAWLCKGLQADSGRLGHEIAERALPGARHAVLSGPTFAVELARGQPTAMVCASRDAALAADTVALLHHGPLRVYTSDDPVGVEVGGAVKNVMAIATGIADGLPSPAGAAEPGLGLNARAALVTRGLAEMTRLGVRMGARAETFMGLSGLGDLVLTATGSLSRNRRVGQELAAGRPLARILEDLGHVAEGVRCAPVVLARAQALGVPMPITEAVVDVLDGRCTPAAAVERLLAREARPETA